MKLSNQTLELIEEEAFFSDIPVDRLLVVYEQAYYDPPPAHMSREQYALNRVTRFVSEKCTQVPNAQSKTLSTIKRIINQR